MPSAVPILSQSTLVLRSLRYFWRTHAAVAMGVAAATAVIVGALVVGDSVRGSLRGLVLDRLSSIECMLHSRTFFDPQVIDELSLPASPKISLAPTIILSSSTIESRRDGNVLRASQVQVLAVDESFSKQLLASDTADFPSQIGEDEVVINAALARELNVAVGDELTLRISQTSGVPADNPLGRRDETPASVPRQKLIAVMPDDGVGGVSFLAGQAVPRNVFASLATIQDILECGARVNGVLALSSSPSQSVSPVGQELCDKLNLQLQPKLEDYGLALAHHRRVFPDPKLDSAEGSNEAPTVVYDYYQLSSDELIIDEVTSDAMVEKLGEVAQKQITYLGNSITKIVPLASDLATDRTLASQRALEASRKRTFGKMLTVLISGSIDISEPPVTKPLSREVPYSIVIGVDAKSELDFEKYTPLASEQILLPYCWVNSWLADQLDVAAGDWIEVKYFEPETVDGNEVENAIRLMVAAIVPVTEPIKSYRRIQPAVYDLPPTVFNDPNLTPSVPGVTDQDSISNWDLPFELALKDLILPVDDAYWSNHRLTPKVFLPYRYASSSRVFGSRFGQTTAIRFETKQVDSADSLRSRIEEALLTTRADKGLIFTPIRQIQLKSASGTTPFDMLFLSLSFFVIVAALLLVALLFKLGLQTRTEQLGMLAAHGFTAGRIRQILLREMAIVSLVGAAIGILLGLAYARLMIAGLETWWVGAISSPFLQFVFTAQSLIVGAVAGMLTSLITIYLSLRKLARSKPLSLLRGENQDSIRFSRKLNRFSIALACMGGLFACGLILGGLGQSGMARAGSFFGSGMLLLAASLIGLRQWIESGVHRGSRPERGSILELAWRSICRNPTRSSLCLGLLAVASFLIASMGVFQVSPNERGYGGFNLIAESSQPIYQNIASESVRRDFIGQAESTKLAGTSIVPFKARRGEDASCNNLFQVTEPTILGVPNLLQEVYDLAPSTARFDWAATLDSERPWAALDRRATGSPNSPIPVIVDQNTAAWSLKQGGSLDADIKLKIGQQEIYFRTVGLLSNSVLQGKLLIGEANFQTLFPKVSGYNFFLIRSGATRTETVASTLEKGWGDVGLDVQSSQEVLQKLLGVQNTYITAFQSLGALGLLLGTFGLVAVQIRSVVERRRELAIMQVVGFSKSRIARMLTIETILLLVGGLIVGILCASVALIPYIIEVQPQLSFFNPLLMLVVVMVAGIVAALIAVKTATSQPVLASLRSE